jgi:hypothetical protein
MCLFICIRYQSVRVRACFSFFKNIFLFVLYFFQIRFRKEAFEVVMEDLLDERKGVKYEEMSVEEQGGAPFILSFFFYRYFPVGAYICFPYSLDRLQASGE